MKLTEEQIIDVLTENIENIAILNCRWLEDKEFWTINIKTKYGISVQELIDICNDLEINTDFIFIDADTYNSFRISIFEK